MASGEAATHSNYCEPPNTTDPIYWRCVSSPLPCHSTCKNQGVETSGKLCRNVSPYREPKSDPPKLRCVNHARRYGRNYKNQKQQHVKDISAAKFATIPITVAAIISIALAHGKRTKRLRLYRAETAARRCLTDASQICGNKRFCTAIFDWSSAYIDQSWFDFVSESQL